MILKTFSIYPFKNWIEKNNNFDFAYDLYWIEKLIKIKTFGAFILSIDFYKEFIHLNLWNLIVG
jgi:hypothetical protein